MHQPKHIVPTGHTTRTGITIGAKYEPQQNHMNRDAELVQSALLRPGRAPTSDRGARLQVALLLAAILIVTALATNSLPALAGLNR
jgi:hypothetical protein